MTPGAITTTTSLTRNQTVIKMDIPVNIPTQIHITGIRNGMSGDIMIGIAAAGKEWSGKELPGKDMNMK